MTRWVVGGLALAVVALLFVLTTPEEVTPESTPAIPDPTTTTRPMGNVALSDTSQTLAALPDGTPFLVTVDPGVPDEWLGSTAGIVMDIDELPAEAGIVDIRPHATGEPSFEDGRYSLPVAGALVTIGFREHALRALGPDAENIIATSIRADIESGYPVLLLAAPFRWGADSQLDVHMSVRFSTFEVRRGCYEYAASCSPSRDVQVIWAAHQLHSAPPPSQPEVSIVGPADMAQSAMSVRY